jgi:hypothetical protein
MLALLTLVLRPIFAVVSVLSPVATILGWIVSALNSHVGRKVLYALLVALAFASGDVTGRVREYKYMEAKSTQEVASAVASANAARDAAEKKFTAGRFSNRPSIVPGRVHHGSDGFSRD